MGLVIVLALLASVGFTALLLPWVGVAGAYLIGILNPQSIWSWSFEGLRPVYWVLLPTLIGVGFMGARGRLRWGALANVRVLCLLIIWSTGMLSWWFAPYSMNSVPSGQTGVQYADFIMVNLSKIVLLTLAAMLCVRTANQLKVMATVMLLSGIYLAWWVNDQYFFKGGWGRLGGPVGLDGSGTYRDENLFGTLLAATFPFVWFAAFSTRQYWLRLLLFLCVPVIWHAVFLTGSRGALLALGAAMILVAVRTKRRSISVALVVLFVIAFAWQAGDTMKSRATSIGEYSEDASATSRLDAWEVGLRMMVSHPLIGVGPGAFMRAFPDFSARQPLQAHNTFVQFGAEFGPCALIALVGLFGSCIFPLWRIKSDGMFGATKPTDHDLYMREATLASIVSLVVNSFFLSLQLFEVLYFLVFMSSALAINYRERFEKNISPYAKCASIPSASACMKDLR
jgi:O-antigen ligase